MALLSHFWYLDIKTAAEISLGYAEFSRLETRIPCKTNDCGCAKLRSKESICWIHRFKRDPAKLSNQLQLKGSFAVFFLNGASSTDEAKNCFEKTRSDLA